MKILKKAFKIFGLVVLALMASICIYACASVPKLSKSDKAMIAAVMQAPLPELVNGETGFADSQSHRIWYERIRPEKNVKGSVLLIMGHGNDALSWPPDFISGFTDQGYEVIRFDHRGTGLSTSTEKWKKKNAYTLTDMSEDVIAILNTIGLKKAHIVGVSMGGMIAQLVAINHPEKIETLSLIMTTGDALGEEPEPMSEELLPKMISAVLKHGVFGGKKGKIKLQLVQRKLLMGDATGDIDVQEMAETSLYNQVKRDGYHFITARHHQQAILLSSSRYAPLQKIQLPTLVIHGELDPVIPISHGKKLAETIPNTSHFWVANMGHDLPEAAIPEICEEMMLHFEQSK
ncbi:alpha/beta hydrolase [Aggregatimonas sangjinii]|uniref:Alpha/beta hydrolase n=1 Tax=Aggregatimonas sangjinii TaxID=2583587 RepID=A0A5B7SXG1_9FLAO|nr:alpha/beta hydrolase [Aggregatimonas sangjinii]QCX01768.1 alpha/beta hydrolase [Aggregatimonas sangjinii]